MEPHDPIRVLIVDDNDALRLVIQSVLRRHADIRVVGEAKSGVEALTLVSQLAPQVVVTDINMPRMNGVETTRRMKSGHPEVKVVGLTLNDDIATTTTMYQAGASVVVQKDRVLEDLHQAIISAVVPSLYRAQTGTPDVLIEGRDTSLPASASDSGDSSASTSLT